MRNDLFAPCIGITAVVADAGVVVDHRAVEIQQEQVCCDRIGQRSAVVALIFIVPVLHRIVIRICQRNRINALIHLHKFMCIGADRRDVVLHGKIDIRCTDAVFRFGNEASDNDVLPFAGEPSAAAEFREFEGIGAVIHRLDLCIEACLCGSAQCLIVILHPEVNFIDNFQQINLKLHGRKQRAVHNNLQFAVFIELCGHIVADRMPEPQKFHIVILDKTDRAQVIQFFLPEAERAEMVNLIVDLLHHFRCENDALVAAFEIILTAEIGVLVENDLIHIEFVEVSVQQGNDNRFKLHVDSSFLSEISRQPFAAALQLYYTSDCTFASSRNTECGLICCAEASGSGILVISIMIITQNE